MKKIVLCGPPRSGKSCMRQGLKDAIRRIPGAPYPYVLTACPDGEGAWFQETVNGNPELAAAAKAAYKAKFTPEYVARVGQSVAACCLPLTLVDIGGIPSPENEAICASATDAVLLMPKDMSEAAFAKLQAAYKAAGLEVPENLDEVRESWHGFAAKLGLTVVAELCSDYHGTEDTVPQLGEDGVYQGSVHHLERGELIADRPTIRALAEILVQLVKEDK